MAKPVWLMVMALVVGPCPAWSQPPDHKASRDEPRAQAFRLARANIRYSISGLVNLRAEQMHTAIGCWNHFYHHGRFIQTTVSRPEILRSDRAFAF